MFNVNLKNEFLKVPVDLLLRIHSDLSSKEVRTDLEEYLREYKKQHGEKAHLAEGLYIDSEGVLAFNSCLYTEAVYRGKIDTRTKTAREVYDKLKRELELLEHMGFEQKKAIATAGSQLLSNKICTGESIADDSLYLLTKMELMKRLLSTDLDGEASEHAELGER